MLMTGWLLVTLVIAVPLIGVASRAIGQRRENLALVAQGK
jgi:ABC-type Co2+ transport system permease subunit